MRASRPISYTKPPRSERARALAALTVVATIAGAPRAWAGRAEGRLEALPSLSAAVLIVEDPSFEPLPVAKAERILRIAEKTYRERFGVPGLDLSVRRTLSSSAYFAALDGPEWRECLERQEAQRVHHESDFAQPDLIRKISAFLGRWPLAAMQPAFPPAVRPRVTSLRSAARMLVGQMRVAASTAFAARLAGGEPVLSEVVRGRRFTDWLCAFEVQHHDDIVITNAYVYYDLLVEPYPHAVYHGSRLSGAVMQSEARDAFYGRGVFVSTFGLGDEVPNLAEAGRERLSDADKERYLGSYLLAHELGHAVSKIPDVYDHGQSCLMSTDYASSYLEGFLKFEKTSGKCQRCQIYVDARARVARGEQWLEQGNLRAAEREFHRGVRTLPADVDGSLNSYLAQIYIRMARHEARMAQWRDVERYAQRALMADPLARQAKLLLRMARAHAQAPTTR